MELRRKSSLRPLSGLTAAVYLLKCISDGLTKYQITYGRFSGNTYQVNILMNFLRDNHWLEEKDDGKMKVTRDGKMWIRRYKFSILNK